MAQINLLNKGTNSSFNFSGLISRLVFWVVFLIFLGAVGYYGYAYVEARRVNKKIIDTQNEIKKIQADIQSNSKRDEIITRQGQIAEYKALDKNRILWSNFIPELARITLNSVKYASITATAEGRLDLQAIAPNYESVDQFLSVFEDSNYNRCINDVKLTSLGKAQSAQSLQTRFAVSISYNPSMIKQAPSTDSEDGSGGLCK